MDFFQHRRQEVPVKTNRRSSVLDFVARINAGKLCGISSSTLVVCASFSCRSLAFFRFPICAHCGGIGKLFTRKDMRMTTHQFFADGTHHILKIEQTLFLRQLRIKHHLKQQITQL